VLPLAVGGSLPSNDTLDSAEEDDQGLDLFKEANGTLDLLNQTSASLDSSNDNSSGNGGPLEGSGGANDTWGDDALVLGARPCSLRGAGGERLPFPPGLCGDPPSGQLNQRPIVGILAQEPGRSMRRALERRGWSNVSSYVAASYVKSFESAGLRVAPILINQEPEYYEMMAKSLNGIVFPGGAASITDRSGYGRAGAALYRHVLAAAEEGSPLPLWATCLGFEMLLYLATEATEGGLTSPLTGCKASNRKDPLFFTDEWSSSQLFGSASAQLVWALNSRNITSNFHKWCVLPETLTELGLDESFALLSTSTDDNGLEYVSTVEHRRLPLFGTQWHPEKPAYEWRDGLTGIPRRADAVAANQHLMRVFAGHVRRNQQSFASEKEEESHLIYRHDPFPVQTLYRSSFLQVYFF